jgi:hypothetical protein
MTPTRVLLALLILVFGCVTQEKKTTPPPQPKPFTADPDLLRPHKPKGD